MASSDLGPDVVMLSGYPFYMKGADPAALQAIADKTRAELTEILGPQLKSLTRMGSSAIDGIAGTPICDLLAEISPPHPVGDDLKAKLAAKGFECKGPAPHNPNDEWYFGGEGKPGHLGRIVLHTVPEGDAFVHEMRVFVEYVNTHPDAFKRYNDVKLESALLLSKGDPEEDGKLLAYKHRKEKVCNEVKEEAIAWGAKRDAA